MSVIDFVYWQGKYDIYLENKKEHFFSNFKENKFYFFYEIALNSSLSKFVTLFSTTHAGHYLSIGLPFTYTLDIPWSRLWVFQASGITYN